ncbi:MAG: hypothetical protein ACYDFU_08955 [Nitrospirota bacterium]
MNPLFLILSISAICVMLYALYRVIALQKKIPGGTVKDTSSQATSRYRFTLCSLNIPKRY